MYNPFTLEGKSVLITGASSGIGAETAIECSKLGATVIITGRNEERLQSVLTQLEASFSQKHQYVIADLSSEEEIQSLVEAIGPIDGLVNNAGVNRVKPIAFIKSEDLEYIFQNNTFSSVLLTKMLLKKKKLNR